MHTKSFLSVMFILGIFLIAAGAGADEGMWPLYDLNKLDFDALYNRGLELTPDQIFNPGQGGLSDAVIDLGGGTASFVSEDGLIITNHHVAFGAIQRQSTVDTNYLRDGFYAPTREDEIPAIGYSVYVTLAVDDVTDQVKSVLTDDMDDLARYQAIENKIKEIVAACENGRDVRCEVAEMFEGISYTRYTYFQIRDVRIVYAPPDAIGKYGGEIDNWMWPRHTGDFSFLRAYVAPDGSSAEFSRDNVPYHPPVFLPIASNGVREGDFAMLIGFPGRTMRFQDSYSLDYLINVYYPNSVRHLKSELAIIDEASDLDSAVALRLASSAAGLNNWLKKSQGTIEGFKRSHILDARGKQEQALTDFLKSDPQLEAKYGYILPAFDSLNQEGMKTAYEDMYLGWLTRGSDYLSMASTIYRWAVEREKPDAEREPRYQDRDTTRTLERLKTAQINLIPSVDKTVFRYLVNLMSDLPSGQNIEAIENLFAGVPPDRRDSALARLADKYYAQTKVGNLDERVKMFHMSKTELENLHDPFIDLAIALFPDYKAMRERDKKASGATNRLTPKLVEAYAIWKNYDLYPDANGTKRFSYGSVKGYSPQDAVWYTYMTSLTGLMDKETGKDPFIVPGPLKEAYFSRNYGTYIDPLINDVPVNFLTDNDGTNGNSGSPVINGKGELIGLNFDGDYEGLGLDYMYRPDLCRSIMVDIRYVLFLIDRVYHLDNLMNELTIH